MFWIQRIILCFILLHCSSVLAHEDILKKIYLQLTEHDQKHQFDGVTYSLTYQNALLDDFLIPFPGQSLWGLSKTLFPSYGFNKDWDPDFGLLHCQSDRECQPIGQCMPLSAFKSSRSDPDIKMCVGMADLNLDRIYNLMIKAEHFIDITTLEPFPDLRFKATLRNALNYLANTGRPITIRILDGLYEPIPTAKAKTLTQKQLMQNASATTYSYLQDLVRDLKTNPNAHLKIYIAGMRTCAATPFSTCGSQSPSEYMALSWNHSKIINVDGKYILTGGVNQYTEDYLEPFPILDLMAEIQGPAANSTIGFVNMLWDFVRNNSNDYLHVIEYGFENNNIIKNQLPQNVSFNLEEAVGDSEILSIGKTGGGILTNGQQENTSDLAMYLLLNSATHSIYIAQQSLKAAFDTWPYDVVAGVTHTNLISSLARLLLNDGDVYIVTSPFADQTIPGSGDYSSQTTKQELWDKIKTEVNALVALDKFSKQAKDSHLILCDHLHIANVQFSDDVAWDEDHLIYDHYKFFMIDEHVFYIGSQNFYPANLQEYGYVIDDDNAAKRLIEKFWQPLWLFSSKNKFQPSDCG